MSVRVTAWAYRLQLPPLEKFVLVVYADHAGPDGTGIWPSVRTVARKTGYSTRAVQNGTRRLEERGLLIGDGKSRRGTNCWAIPIGLTDEQLVSMGVEVLEETPPPTFSTGGVENLTIPVEKLLRRVGKKV